MYDIPSLALRLATPKLDIVPRKRSLTANPAASSADLLIRKPDDNLSKDWLSEPLCSLRRLCATKESTFVLTLNPMTKLPVIDHGEPSAVQGEETATPVAGVRY
jgi:hypothetical protein